MNRHLKHSDIELNTNSANATIFAITYNNNNINTQNTHIHTRTHVPWLLRSLPNNTNFTTRNANLSHNLNFEHLRILESTIFAIIISTILTETFRNHFVCLSIVHHSKCLMFVENAKFYWINWYFFFSVDFVSNTFYEHTDHGVYTVDYHAKSIDVCF